MKGFALLELLIVIAIIAILLTLIISLGINFYNRQQLDSTTEGVIQALRRAQLKSMSQADYSFGVYVGSGQTGQYILFRGSSYGSRDDEEVFGIPSNISFSGLSEVIFSKLGGIPSVTGDIILTSGGSIRTININEAGRISYILPLGCWGAGGSCDPLCQYANYGSLTDYYTDPGCSESCSPAGSFYINPGGTCSDDGSGSCYKVGSSLSASTTCTQDLGCEQGCTGTCTPCDQLNRWRCRRQDGCAWTGGQCIDDPGCVSCDQFPDSGSCGSGPNQPQYGCSWGDSKWYWVLDGLEDGYSSYITCVWLE